MRLQKYYVAYPGVEGHFSAKTSNRKLTTVLLSGYAPSIKQCSLE